MERVWVLEEHRALRKLEEIIDGRYLCEVEVGMLL